MKSTGGGGRHVADMNPNGEDREEMERCKIYFCIAISLPDLSPLSYGRPPEHFQQANQHYGHANINKSLVVLALTQV